MSRVSISNTALSRVLEDLLRVEPGSIGRTTPREANVEALQAATGLARGTVHNALSYLAPVLRQRPHRPPHSVGSRGGKPTIMHSVSTDAAEALVLQFDHDRGTVFSANAFGNLTQRGIVSVNVDADPELAIKMACSLLEEPNIKTPIEWDRIVGFGVSIPAPVDPKSHRTIGGVLPAWEEIDMGTLISKYLGEQVAELPVIADNDGNLAALAEHRYGKYVQSSEESLLFVKTVPGAIGIGAGAVIHGRPLHGQGLAMEFGHLRVDSPDAPLVCAVRCPHCRSEECLQARLSTKALIPSDPSLSLEKSPKWEMVVKRALDSVVSLNNGRLTAIREGDVNLVAECDARLELLKQHPDIAAIVFAAREMGRALAKVVTLLDPAVIAIGGPLGSAWLGKGASSMSSAIGDPLRDALTENAPLSKARQICPEEATVTDDAARGAAAAVLDEHLTKFLIDRAGWRANFV